MSIKLSLQQQIAQAQYELDIARDRLAELEYQKAKNDYKFLTNEDAPNTWNTQDIQKFIYDLDATDDFDGYIPPEEVQEYMDNDYERFK